LGTNRCTDTITHGDTNVHTDCMAHGAADADTIRSADHDDTHGISIARTVGGADGGTINSADTGAQRWAVLNSYNAAVCSSNVGAVRSADVTTNQQPHAKSVINTRSFWSTHTSTYGIAIKWTDARTIASTIGWTHVNAISGTYEASLRGADKGADYSTF
jgi:hypothetical protein